MLLEISPQNIVHYYHFTMGTDIKKLLDLVDTGDLILPEIQRDFVWKKSDVLLLFDSLFQTSNRLYACVESENGCWWEIL